MENAILILVLLAIVGSIAYYLVRAKKRGQKCIGCPYSKACGKSCCTCAEKEHSAPQKNQDQ